MYILSRSPLLISNRTFAFSQDMSYDIMLLQLYIIVSFMLLKYCKLANKLKNDLVDIELELRFKILYKENDLDNFDKYLITYYRSIDYPDITFRKINNNNLESKETVERTTYRNTILVLSVEQKNCNVKTVKCNSKTIYRKVINLNPLIEIIKRDTEYYIEIEFDETNYMEVDKIISKYKNKYWPSIKPMEISTINLCKKLHNLNNWHFSIKADGLHVIIFEKDEKQCYIYDNGKIDNELIINPVNVYEGEMMDNEILLYDCLRYGNRCLLNCVYSQRYEFIPTEKRKPIYKFNDLSQLKQFVDSHTDIKNDGFIITNEYKRNLVYKSKHVSTVDLRYKNGYLFLENELESDRIPKTEYNYIEDEIYEFDINMNLIKKREDKIFANYKMPYDNNQLYNIVNSIGIPNLRVFNNKIKKELLDLLPENINLLDIGSGKGGDINKWNRFKKVYAVDPQLEMRTHLRNVIEIIDYPSTNLDYQAVSLFFVPWNDDFINIIAKAKYFVWICMDKPVDYECNAFSIKIIDNKIHLNIPNTETALNIIEDKIDVNKIINKLENLNFSFELKFRDFNKTEEELKLKDMYSYYYFIKNG